MTSRTRTPGRRFFTSALHPAPSPSIYASTDEYCQPVGQAVQPNHTDHRPESRRPFPVLLLAATLMSGMASAASLQLEKYDLQPNKQRVLMVGPASLGYPVGDTYVGLALDCRTGKTTILNLGSDYGEKTFTTYGAHPDAALTKALMAAGMVRVKPGELLVKRTGAPVTVSRCQGNTLDATLFTTIFGSSSTFNVAVASENQKPVPFAENPSEYDVYSVDLQAQFTPVKAQYRLSDLVVEPGENLGLDFNSVQVMVSDGTSVYPIFYGGQNQDNAALSKALIGPVLTIYATTDGKKWTKSTLNLKTNRIQSVPTGKPTLPIRS